MKTQKYTTTATDQLIRLTTAFMVGMFVMYWVMI